MLPKEYGAMLHRKMKNIINYTKQDLLDLGFSSSQIHFPHDRARYMCNNCSRMYVTSMNKKPEFECVCHSRSFVFVDHN